MSSRDNVFDIIDAWRFEIMSFTAAENVPRRQFIPDSTKKAFASKFSA